MPQMWHVNVDGDVCQKMNPNGTQCGLALISSTQRNGHCVVGNMSWPKLSQCHHDADVKTGFMGGSHVKT